MDGKSQKSNPTGFLPDNAELSARRIRDLQRERNTAVRGKIELALLLKELERKIRSFLEELKIDETLLPVTRSEGAESLIGVLFVVIKALIHGTESCGRNQRALHRANRRLQRKVERLRKSKKDFEEQAKQLEKDNKALENANARLEIKLDLLDSAVRRAKEKK